MSIIVYYYNIVQLDNRIVQDRNKELHILKIKKSTIQGIFKLKCGWLQRTLQLLKLYTTLRMNQQFSGYKDPQLSLDSQRVSPNKVLKPQILCSSFIYRGRNHPMTYLWSCWLMGEVKLISVSYNYQSSKKAGKKTWSQTYRGL